MKKTKGGQVLLRVVEYGPQEGGVVLRAAWASEALVPGGTLPVIQGFSPHEGHNGADLCRVAASSKVSSPIFSFVSLHRPGAHPVGTSPNLGPDGRPGKSKLAGQSYQFTPAPMFLSPHF